MPQQVGIGYVDHLPEKDRLLLQAVQQRDLAAVQQQLAAGADVSARCNLGLTPLHVAARSVDRDVVAALLEAGADPSAVIESVEMYGHDMEAITPLDYLGSGDLLKSTCSEYVLNSSGVAVWQGHKCTAECDDVAHVMQQLVAAGARVVQPDSGEVTPLHDAAEVGCPTMVAALLQAGADPGSTDHEGWTVLHAAANGGSLEVVQQVLGALGSNRAAPPVQALGERGTEYAVESTPLHLAARWGHLEVAEALIAAGADKEQQDGEERTALQVALAGGMCHLVPLLVTPSNIHGPDGDPPLHLAATLPRCDLEHHKQWRQPLMAAATRAVAQLLAAGADACGKDRDGCTALEVAASRGQPEVLQMLLEHTQQQQQQQHRAAQAGGIQPPLSLLRDLGFRSLAWCNGGTWRLLLTLAADTLGPEGVHALWGHLKQRLLEVQPGPGCQHPELGHAAGSMSYNVPRAWADCWVDSCSGLLTQQATITRRLQELVTSRHEQQQEQQSSCGRPSKRPRLARELQSLLEQQQAMPYSGATETAASGGPWHSIPGDVFGMSGSRRAARAAVRARSAALHQSTELQTVAASGRAEDVQAALAHMEDRVEGLVTAAAGAGRAGHWGLCVALLRELVMLQGGSDWRAAHTVTEAVRAAAQEQQQQQQQQQEEEQVVDGQLRAGDPQQKYVCELRAAAGVCDALFADWLAVRQQQVRERRAAVVAAVAAAMGEAAPLPAAPLASGL